MNFDLYLHGVVHREPQHHLDVHKELQQTPNVMIVNNQGCSIAHLRKSNSNQKIAQKSQAM